MKAKMDEIDEIWTIYKRNLGQNSRWNINLSLKINFGSWIRKLGAIWPLDRYITIGITSRSSNQHERDLGRQITLHEGEEISSKNQRYISDILAIFTEISPLRFFFTNIVSIPPDTRYIGDIFRYFSPCSYYTHLKNNNKKKNANEGVGRKARNSKHSKKKDDEEAMKEIESRKL